MVTWIQHWNEEQRSSVHNADVAYSSDYERLKVKSCPGYGNKNLHTCTADWLLEEPGNKNNCIVVCRFLFVPIEGSPPRAFLCPLLFFSLSPHC